MSGKFGNFRFDDVEPGETYIISVTSRRYIFQAQVITVTEDTIDLSFTGLAQFEDEEILINP